MDKYDVHKDGRLLGKGLSRLEVARLIHVSTTTIDTARFGKHDSDYPLHIKGYEIHLRAGNKKHPTNIPVELWEEWEKMNIAAEMLRQGVGKIISVRHGKGYRKVTVPR